MFLSASPESLATVSAEQILSKLNLLPFLASHTPRTQTCFKPLTWEITVNPDPTKKRQPPEESPLSAGPIRSRRSQVSGNADRQEWGGVLQPHRLPGGTGAAYNHRTGQIKLRDAEPPITV